MIYHEPRVCVHERSTRRVDSSLFIHFFPAPEYIAKRRSPGEIQKRARNHSFLPAAYMISHLLLPVSPPFDSRRLLVHTVPLIQAPVQVVVRVIYSADHRSDYKAPTFGHKATPKCIPSVFLLRHSLVHVMPTLTLTRVIVQTLARRRVSTQHRYPWNRVELIQSLLTHCSRNTYT